jgi:ABC-2 type transport system ATP-binding protein
MNDMMASDAAEAVSIDRLTKRYGRTLALDEVSFNVRRGELFALLGPNGAGKTTLLHILCTIMRADGGTARINGIDIARDPLGARRNIGVVFQEPSLDDRLTVRENLEFHGLVYGVPLAVRRKRIDEMLAVVELGEWSERLVRTMSSGMKRRLEIARALVHESRLLFLDEPTVGLDAQSRERMWRYIHKLRKDHGLTVVVTTHYIEEVEGCDRVCIIDHGKILAIDPPGVLKSRHGQELLRIVPRDEAAGAEIRDVYADRIVRERGEIVLRSDGDAFVESVFGRFGPRIRRLAVEEPSLESVFLTLTGRELRDQAASARDLTFEFGKRGGEHTR